ncbi:MAG: LacI family DNA-binding transcriptional regulator [Chloroflexi bacterium]|nr:LacI family DNA-binding transcriptional regulator [Chloroflexota bacterium]
MSERKMEDGRGRTRPTIRDIASLSGVSVATVSRVLNGRPDVAPATRDTVLRLIRERGYTINRNARGLVGRSTDLIALTVPVVHAEYFARIVSGAAEALYRHDVRFVLCPTMHRHDREVSVLHRLMHGTTDGAMLIYPEETNAELIELRGHGYPFVVVDPHVPLGDDIPVVSAGSVAGARSAVEHLIELGHRRIAVITGPQGVVATLDRLAGYRAALLAAGLPINPGLVRESDFLVEGGYQAASRLLSGPNPPTAIFAFNDNMAFGALRAAREKGVCVPADLSIVGFDDVEVATLVHPMLSTVHQPMQEMGRVAASLLLRLLDNQPVDTLRLELATRLVVRGTTAPPRSSSP